MKLLIRLKLITLWEGLAATYRKGHEGVQLYDLTVKANTAKRGTQTVEQYYIGLQRLWREIELRQPNPMQCAEDITIFNRLRQEAKLYQFLSGVGEEFDGEIRDLLKTDPLPTPESAYATIRRERDRRIIMTGEGSREPLPVAAGIGSGFIAAKNQVKGANQTGQIHIT